MEAYNKKILVTGARGMLGRDLCGELQNAGYRVVPVDREEFDITDANATRESILDCKPDLAVHCAAYTNVDACEDNQNLCFSVNVDGARHVALAMNELKAPFYYISTDYIFNGKGKSPYLETDSADPLNDYGKAKWLGELAAKAGNPRTLAIRTSWLYGQHGRNFVHAMVELSSERKEMNVVNDQIGRPTYTRSVSKSLIKIIDVFVLKNTTPNFDVVNICDSGVCSWHEFAVEIFKVLNLDILVNPIGTDAFPRPAKRPGYSVLDLGLFERITGSAPPHWKESLREFLSESRL